MENKDVKPLINLCGEYLINQNIKLGQGATGQVYIGRSIYLGQQIAVKIIDMLTITNQVTQYLLQMQKTALMIVNNQYVLRAFKVVQNDQHCYIVTQFCNGGTLKDYIKQQGKLPESECLRLLVLLLKGYLSLLQKHIVHRDIKPANIMLHNKQPKIIDFGYCQIQGYTKPNIVYNVGSPSYMAPQTYQSNLYNHKSQIWALAATFYECLTGHTLDQGKDMNQFFQNIQIYGITIPSGISQKTAKILKWCLQLQARNRPTCQQMFNALLTIQIPRNKVQYSQSMHQQKQKENIIRIQLSSRNEQGKQKNKYVKEGRPLLNCAFKNVHKHLRRSVPQYEGYLTFR